MTTYSITTDAQPIFPDGYNDAMSLFNAGPWTIFLDDNSSIGPQSYALKPSTAMVWPQGVPLWAKGNSLPAAISTGPFRTPNDIVYSLGYQPSTLVATRSSYALASQYGSSTLFPIRKSTFTVPAVPAVKASGDYPFETDVYRSLVITLNITPWVTAGQNPATNLSHFCHLVWFDQDGSFITADKIQLWYQGYTQNSGVGDDRLVSQSIVADVKGKYCFIYHENGVSGTSDGNYSLTVQGSTIPLAPRVDHWTYSNVLAATGVDDTDRFAYSPVWWRNITGQLLNVTSDYAYIEWTDYAKPIFLNNPARNLTLGIRAAGLTTGGEIRIHSQDANLGAAAIWQAIPLAAGTAQYGPYTIPMPITAPAYIVTSGIAGGAVRFNMNWSN